MNTVLGQGFNPLSFMDGIVVSKRQLKQILTAKKEPSKLNTFTGKKEGKNRKNVFKVSLKKGRKKRKICCRTIRSN